MTTIRTVPHDGDERAANSKKAPLSRAFPVRPSGLEPPRGNLPTRPSTLRVYQFRHGRRGGEYSPGPPEPRGSGDASAALLPSSGGATVRTHVRFRPRPREQGVQRHGSDQAPAGDLRLHPQVLGEVRLSADGARHRQGRRARLLVDRARASRQSREDRPAAARSLQAACDRAARPGRGERAGHRAHRGPAAGRLGRRGAADARRGEHRGLRLGARDRRAAGTASICCASVATR